MRAQSCWRAIRNVGDIDCGQERESIVSTTQRGSSNGKSRGTNGLHSDVLGQKIWILHKRNSSNSAEIGGSQWAVSTVDYCHCWLYTGDHIS